VDTEAAEVIDLGSGPVMTDIGATMRGRAGGGVGIICGVC